MCDTQDLPAIVRSSDEMDTRNSGKVHRDTVGTLPESKQSHESCASVSNVIHLTCTPCLSLLRLLFSYVKSAFVKFVGKKKKNGFTVLVTWSCYSSYPDASLELNKLFSFLVYGTHTTFRSSTLESTKSFCARSWLRVTLQIPGELCFPRYILSLDIACSIILGGQGTLSTTCFVM